ncbi:hypothetical protein ACB098_05G086400 [Castanea mollissima]
MTTIGLSQFLMGTVELTLGWTVNEAFGFETNPFRVLRGRVIDKWLWWANRRELAFWFWRVLGFKSEGLG